MKCLYCNKEKDIDFMVRFEGEQSGFACSVKCVLELMGVKTTYDGK